MKSSRLRSRNRWGPLIQTGQLLWPVPVLAGGGIALVAVGLWLNRKRRHDA